MKCPNCSFVNHPQAVKCGRCGRPCAHKPEAAIRRGTAPASAGGEFQPQGQERPSFFSSIISRTLASSSPQPSSTSRATAAENAEPDDGFATPHRATAGAPEAPEQVAIAETAVEAVPSGDSAENQDAAAWRDEVSDRVRDFRRRRARMRGMTAPAGFDPTSSLAFDFNETEGETVESIIEFPRSDEELEVQLSPDGMEPQPASDAAFEATAPAPAAPAVASADFSVGPSEPEPVEIVLDSTPAGVQAGEAADAFAPYPCAPLGKRFIAGVVDALVLASGAGLFALIFWFAGGRISRSPATLAVLGFVALFMVFVYFAVFTGLAGATPGLFSMGLEVRNLEGDSPTLSESFLRAFGYLVSTTALFLGFVWGLVDGDHMTWHDRISGTMITPRS